DERYQKTISLWTFVNDQITKVMMDNLEKDQKGHNPLYIMAISGARGSRQQIRQLAGMRGLMAKPSGDIIELPITSNFKEGLTVLEYFISTHGARKGLSDTALKTADAGYLTRKLVDIAQDVTIEMEDCGTISGIYIYPIKSGDEVIEKLSERVNGRFTCEPIINPYTDEVLLPSDELISPDVAKKLDELEVERVKIRAVITCDSPRGICKKCYGENLASRQMVDIGEAVGIVASQSIGQPGTQLTMRTFHIGGAAMAEARDPEYKAPTDMVITQLPVNLVRDEKDVLVAARRGFMSVATVFDRYELDKIKGLKVKDGDRVKIGDVFGTVNGEDVTAKKVGFILINKKSGDFMHIAASYQIPLDVGGVFQKEVGEYIKKNETIYRFDPINEPIIAEVSGTVR
ncbi:MAG: DNA-directed RNA polymerase subunit beta', partial [Spirochaetia bacterium]|nr:DNA-directed RNA polymerase subunit beta' [Spirochaetia bacterium]